jgi:cytochrome b
MCVGAPGVATPADRARVWDLPTRLFHWALVLLVVAAFVSAKIGGGAMVWHGRLGLAIIGLLAFRIVWGCVGSTYARFGQFVRGPAAIRAYLKGEWQGQGHNPLGALSVLALLGILAAMAGTGLFANDDIAYEGFLVPLIGSEASGRITGIHHLLEKALMLIVALHVGVIAYYARVRKHNLVKPMLTGWAAGKPCESARGGGAGAFVVAVLIAVAAVYAASGALLPPPPPPPATEVPSF